MDGKLIDGGGAQCFLYSQYIKLTGWPNRFLCYPLSSYSVKYWSRMCALYTSM